MYERAENAAYRPPQNLPRAWRERRDQVPMDTLSNFVSTLDHSGGNSGSPIVDTRGDWIGVLHDGNRQYLGTQYVYSSEQARTIATHFDAIKVWLGTVHDAGELVSELVGDKQYSSAFSSIGLFYRLSVASFQAFTRGSASR